MRPSIVADMNDPAERQQLRNVIRFQFALRRQLAEQEALQAEQAEQTEPDAVPIPNAIGPAPEPVPIPNAPAEEPPTVLLATEAVVEVAPVPELGFDAAEALALASVVTDTPASDEPEPEPPLTMARIVTTVEAYLQMHPETVDECVLRGLNPREMRLAVAHAIFGDALLQPMSDAPTAIATAIAVPSQEETPPCPTQPRRGVRSQAPSSRTSSLKVLPRRLRSRQRRSA